jgi:TonB family protein
MPTLGGLRRPPTARQRLGLGVVLSGGAHALLLAVLTVAVTRDPPRPLDNAATDEFVTVGPVGDSTIGIPGWPGDTPAPGPAVERASPSTAAPKTRLPGPTAPGPRTLSARPVRRQVATSAPSRPPVPRPAAPPAATAPTSRGRSVAQSPAPPATAPKPAQAPSGIDVGGAGPGQTPAGGAPQEGSPGRSPLADFRALLARKVKAAWDPWVVYQRVDPGGNLRGSLLVTGIQLRIRGDGVVERAQLADSSGVAPLDDEAMAAIKRMKLPPLPPEILDDKGGFDVKCSMNFDLGTFRFAREINKAIADVWRPSLAYRAADPLERTTLVKLTVGRDGSLAQVNMINSAGIDFLDRNVLEAVKPGMRLPPPPPGYANSPGGTFMFVAFQHHLGEVHVLRPKERIDAD